LCPRVAPRQNRRRSNPHSRITELNDRTVRLILTLCPKLLNEKRITEPFGHGTALIARKHQCCGVAKSTEATWASIVPDRDENSIATRAESAACALGLKPQMVPINVWRARAIG